MTKSKHQPRIIHQVLCLQRTLLPLRCTNAVERETIVTRIQDMISILLAMQNLPEIVGIDLRNNGLGDEDMPEVVNLVQQVLACRPDSDTKPCWIRLSRNRLHGLDRRERDMVDRGVMTLLQMPSVSFVDLTQNPFASLDRQALFSTWTAELFEKCIFICKSALEQDEWTIMIRENRQPGVEKYFILHTHRQFYAMVERIP